MSALREAFDSTFASEREKTRTLRVVRPREPVLAKVGKTLGKLAAQLDGARSYVLPVAGLGCLVAAAWTVALPFGLAAAGGSLLLLDYNGGGGE